ncbi:MAG TPA: 30S ribosomal protein S8e [Euryarchaeota archaeon]|nr:MAG: 30S ribosomal protein S8e [Thermoplasmatales archaeon ex4484_6]HHD15393.1 30S ribosomal protein S8e [Euryarchaeota archaeon]
MALWQGRSRRKSTGGRYRLHRGKRKSEIGREQQITVVGKTTRKRVKTAGGNLKFRVLTSDVANIHDPKKNKTFKATIKTVLENPANPHYVRRNIITKGAIIDTNKGKARVTSRPGQDGVINAVLLK